MKVFVPYYNSDGTEGRGPMVAKPFCFTTLEEAKKYVNRQLGIMGRKADPIDGWENMKDWEIKEFIILEMADAVAFEEERQLRDRLISRMTAEEKRALGIK